MPESSAGTRPWETRASGLRRARLSPDQQGVTCTSTPEAHGVRIAGQHAIGRRFSEACYGHPAVRVCPHHSPHLSLSCRCERASGPTRQRSYYRVIDCATGASVGGLEMFAVAVL
jgi:hypothetical protein